MDKIQEKSVDTKESVKLTEEQQKEKDALEYRNNLIEKFKNMSIATLQGPKRLKDESFDEYKERREMEKIYRKLYLKGRFI